MRRLVLEQPVSQAAIWAARTALFAVTVTAYGLFLVRSGQQGAQGLAALGSGFALAATAVILAAMAAHAIWNRGLKGAGRAASAILVGAILLSGPAYVGYRVVTLPALADIATDIDDPPAFSRSRAALSVRAGHVPQELPREARILQRVAYQKIIPIVTDRPAEEAFNLAMRAATGLGWQVVERLPPGGRSGIGRIDAISSSFILRMPDDITIRVRPRADGSRIDIRSAARLRYPDLGRNAGNILAFADQVQILLSAR